VSKRGGDEFWFEPFGVVSPTERREADRFFEDLVGRRLLRPPVASRRPAAFLQPVSDPAPLFGTAPARSEEAFPEDYEDQDDVWSRLAEDPPTASVTTTPDAALAIPAFADGNRGFVGAPLTAAQSKAAIRWNAEHHPGQSGVDPDSMLATLQSYVDVSALRSALESYNTKNPAAPIDLGTKPVDAILVEAIHQFQMKCYRDSKQHDGMARTTVLDSLGFWPRKGMLAAAQTNDWARGQVRSKAKDIDAAVSPVTDLTRDLSSSNWWESFVNPCFLGWDFNRPIHVYFARKLRQAERWLLSQSRFARKTPADLSRLLDIDEKHRGGRDKASSKGMHPLGLAVDIKYAGNPHIGDYRDKPNGARFFTKVMKRAAAKISGLNLTEEKFPEYLYKLGTDRTKTTGQIYDELRVRDQDLRTYLALAEASDELETLRARGVFVGEQKREPLNGFLNLDRDLVIALRDHACLIWGAVDMGSKSSGDVMHFDCRLDGLGRAVFCGTTGTFNVKHPCWKQSGSPCPQVGDKPKQASTTAHEDWESEAEDDAVGEAPPLLKNPNASDPPGQTLYVKINLGKDSRCVKRDPVEKPKCLDYETFAIRPMTGIFIPENYSPQAAVDLVLYLHGHKTDKPGSDALIAEYWDKQYPVFGLREEINASGMNVILVAPTLALKSESGDLARPDGLDKYLDKVLVALKAYGPYKDATPTLGNLILAAHSGGGTYMRRLATSGNRAAGNVRECWGFDSLYNSGDVDPWRRWAKSDPQKRRLYSYYRGGLPKENSQSLDRDSSSGRIDKLSNIFAIPSQESDHYKLVRLYLRERLKGTPFLVSRSARTPSEQAPDEASEDWFFFDQEDAEAL
jgi:hypothetical protein